MTRVPGLLRTWARLFARRHLATENEHLALFVMADSYVAFSPRLDGIGARFVRAGVGPSPVYARAFEPDHCARHRDLVVPARAHLRSAYDIRATLRGELAKDVALGFEGARAVVSRATASYLYF